MNNIRFSEKINLFILMVLVIFVLSGCDNDGNDRHVVDVEYNFRENDGACEPFFTGFNVGWEERMQLRITVHCPNRWIPKPMGTL